MSEPGAISQLRNLGEYSAKVLATLGIHTREDLQQWGAVKPYVLLKAAGHRVSMNLVYAIEASLMDIHINHLPLEVKQRLKKEVETQQ